MTAALLIAFLVLDAVGGYLWIWRRNVREYNRVLREIKARRVRVGARIRP